MVKSGSPHYKAHRPFMLECDHQLWFAPSLTPSPYEPVWCARCQDYRQMKGRPTGNLAHHDGFVIKRTKSGFSGTCTHESGCSYSLYKGIYWEVESGLESHIIRAHTNHGSTLDFEKIKRDAKNIGKGDPPF